MRQTQKLESLGVLAGGIAHDFNNLLVGILGNASLALEQIPIDSSTRISINEVLAASDRAAALTRQMLAYSGRGHFILERIDLSTYVQETIPLIKAEIPRTVELRLDLDEDIPAIEADAAQVQQLVMNLSDQWSGNNTRWKARNGYHSDSAADDRCVPRGSASWCGSRNWPAQTRFVRAAGS